MVTSNLVDCSNLIFVYYQLLNPNEVNATKYLAPVAAPGLAGPVCDQPKPPVSKHATHA